jgi:hypothetical protein
MQWYASWVAFWDPPNYSTRFLSFPQGVNGSLITPKRLIESVWIVPSATRDTVFAYFS